MPYEVKLEDGMKIQVSSLNRYNWSNYHEILIHTVWEAQQAMLELNYTIILAIMKSNQRPNDNYKQQCLTCWQLQMAKQIAWAVKNNTAMECKKVAEKVGKKLGETPYGKVDKEIATAQPWDRAQRPWITRRLMV